MQCWRFRLTAKDDRGRSRLTGDPVCMVIKNGRRGFMSCSFHCSRLQVNVVFTRCNLVVYLMRDVNIDAENVYERICVSR